MTTQTFVRTFAMIGAIWLLLFPATSHAAKVTYPGPAPCNLTLQDCIDNGTQSGDILLIAVGVLEDLVIDKSLILTSPPGVTSVLGGAGTPYKMEINQGPNDQTVDVRVEHLTMINFHIEASFTAGSNHSFTLSNSTITSIGQVNSVDLFTNVPANFVIDRNNLVPGKYWAVDLSTGPTSQGTTNLLVRGNKITATNSTDNFGGIYMNLQGAATNHVRVLSNLIYNIGSLAITGGMKIDLHGTTQNTIDIYNNTIDDVTTGHGINVTTPDAGSFTALKFNNNIVTNIPGNWINLPGDSGQLTASFDHNTYYQAGAAGYNGYSPGSDTDNETPSYFDEANRLYNLTISPCVNAGVGDVVTLGLIDILGRPRWISTNPDRGAYETPGNLFTSFVKFVDTFDDSQINNSYTYEKGTWTEDGSSLVGSADRKASMLFPASKTCDLCTAFVNVKTSGEDQAGVAGKMWVLLWYQDKNNYVDLLIKPSSNKVLLRQKVNGVIARKDKMIVPMQPFMTYNFEIGNTGTDLKLRVPGQAPISIPIMGSPNGRFGFQAKGTHGFLNEITVY